MQEYNFESASGHVMKGYWIKATDVVVDSTYIKEFYYVLLIDVEKRVALLGDDFIAGCSFTHSAGNDILITAFDAEYQKKALGNLGVGINEICSLEELVNV